MTEHNLTAKNVVARRSYARPSLTVYGSVRELTGAMSGTGTDGSLMFMATGAGMA